MRATELTILEALREAIPESPVHSDCVDIIRDAVNELHKIRFAWHYEKVDSWLKRNGVRWIRVPPPWRRHFGARRPESGELDDEPPITLPEIEPYTPPATVPDIAPIVALVDRHPSFLSTPQRMFHFGNPDERIDIPPGAPLPVDLDSRSPIDGPPPLDAPGEMDRLTVIEGLVFDAIHAIALPEGNISPLAPQKALEQSVTMHLRHSLLRLGENLAGEIYRDHREELLDIMIAKRRKEMLRTRLERARNARVQEQTEGYMHGLDAAEQLAEACAAQMARDGLEGDDPLCDLEIVETKFPVLDPGYDA